MSVSPMYYFSLLFPLAGLLAIALIRRISWRVAIASALVAPLVGEFAILFWVSSSTARIVEPVFWLRFLVTGAIYSPLAFVTMGPWAAFIGALAWLLVKSSSVASRLSFAKFSLIGTLAGAAAGAGFMLLYLLIAVIPEVPVGADHSFVPYLALSGLLAGAVSGCMIAYLATLETPATSGQRRAGKEAG